MTLLFMLANVIVCNRTSQYDVYAIIRRISYVFHKNETHGIDYGCSPIH